MTSTASRRVPRLVSSEPETAHPPESVRLREQLAQLDAERAQALERLAELEAARSGVIRDGTDEQAERHDAEIARTRRAIERCDLRRPALAEALAQAEAAEEAERVATIKREASAVVEAFLATAEQRYSGPARELAAFLEEWNRVTVVARQAGVPTPNDVLRCRDGRVVKPARTEVETYTVYLDEHGCETGSAYPAGSYREIDGQRFYDGGSGRGWSTTPTPPRQMVERTRVVSLPAEIEPSIRSPDLALQVCLPGLRVGEDTVWPAPQIASAPIAQPAPDRVRHSASEQRREDDGPRVINVFASAGS